MDIENALLRLVKACRESHKLDQALMTAGYASSPYFSILGHIIDGIYFLIGDNTETLEESVAYQVLNNDSLSDSECVSILLRKHERSVVEDYLSGVLRI